MEISPKHIQNVTADDTVIFYFCYSTLSSGVNAMAAVVLMDMIQPIYKTATGTVMKEKPSAILTKILCIAFLSYQQYLLIYSYESISIFIQPTPILLSRRLEDGIYTEYIF